MPERTPIDELRQAVGSVEPLLPVLLVASAVLATDLPARRAAPVDLSKTMRSE